MVATLLAPIAIASVSGKPPPEQDALPDWKVPNAEDTQPSNARAGAGATLVASALAATAPSTPPAIKTPAVRERYRPDATPRVNVTGNSLNRLVSAA